MSSKFRDQYFRTHSTNSQLTSSKICHNTNKLTMVCFILWKLQLLSISFCFFCIWKIDSSSFPRRSSDGAADMPTLHRPYPLFGGSYPEQANYRTEVSKLYFQLKKHNLFVNTTTLMRLAGGCTYKGL